MRRKDVDPYYDQKVYHYAALVALDGSGRVSALCYKRPRSILARRGQSWTLTQACVTCPKCRTLLLSDPASAAE